MSTNYFPAANPYLAPDPQAQFARLLQLRSIIQQQQYQQQMQPLQLQAEQNQLQMQQQQLRDTQAGQQAFGEWDGKSYTDLAGLIIKHGGSLGAANQVAAYGLTQQEKLANILKTQADAGKAQVDTLQKQHDTAAGAVNALLSLPDDQLQQGVLDTAQRGMKEGWFDAQHYQMAQQLAQQSPQQIRAALPNIAKGYQAESQLAEDALKHAQAFEAQQRGLETQAMMQAGGTPQMMDVKYQNLKQQQALGQPLGVQDQAFVKAYEQRKLLVPQTVANIRVSGLEQSRMMPVIDTKQGNALTYQNVADINAANKAEPGRFVPAGEGAKALSKEALLEDIRGNIQQVRADLSNPNMPEFTAGQRAQIAIAMGSGKPTDAIGAVLRGGVMGNLTAEQQQYLIDHAQLIENSMAMRSALGAGQGSEDVRSAITATVPGPQMPSKAFGLKQLDSFEKTVNRVGRGVPNVPLAGNAPPTGGGQFTVTDPRGVTHTFLTQQAADAFRQAAGIK